MLDILLPRDSKYQLAIPELFHPYFHGGSTICNQTFRHYLYGSYLCAYLLTDEDAKDDDLYPTDNSGPWGLSKARRWPDVAHPFIRNYREVAKKYTVDIVELVYIEDTEHLLCIPKTFWLRIFQRKCRKWYKSLQVRIRESKNPKALLRRQLTGK